MQKSYAHMYPRFGVQNSSMHRLRWEKLCKWVRERAAKDNVNAIHCCLHRQQLHRIICSKHVECALGIHVLNQIYVCFCPLCSCNACLLAH